jgi:predicted N-acetyltransferase YhbS
MNETSWSLRPAEERDLDGLHALSREAGWPHRVEDWRFLMQLGHGTVAADEDGRIGGSAAWWPIGEAVASVGMVIVAPALQGRGIGNRLMARVFAEAGGRRLHLNATAAGRRLYERSGFAAAGTLRQHQGIATPAGTAASAERVRTMRPADRAAVGAIDLAATGTSRTALLDALAAAGTGHVHEEGGRITGYAFTRPFGRGTVLGPIVAEDEGTALALVSAAVVRCSGTFLRADTPIAAGPFRELLIASNLPEVSSALPMVRGVSGAGPGPARIYCVAAQALG